MIEFETLAIKADTNDIHTNFLLKKNFRSNIIKTILEYLLIVVSETLKEWKVVIISVRQGYESTEGRQDYRTELGIIFGERRVFMNIRKYKDKDGKPRCFNYNIYRYIAKDC